MRPGTAEGFLEIWATSSVATRSSARLVSAHTASTAIAVTPPSQPSADATNFLGLSLELSFVNYSFGNSTAEVPQRVIDHLSALHAHMFGKPGGNSRESST